MLDDRQISRYHDDGYLVIEDFLDADTRAALKERALDMVDTWDPTGEAANSVFTTDEQHRTSTDEFLASASGIWCFFEEGAFDADGTINRPRRLSINKIGHAMHDLDPVFEAATYSPDLAEVASDIGLADALALQTMYIFKQPGIGGEVNCHQDATFLYTDPMSVTGFWFAIEDATIENGCLWAAPGHHRGPLRQVFERTERALSHDPSAEAPSVEGTDLDDGPGLTRFSQLDATPLPSPDDGLVPLEVPAGTLVILHGLLPHWSDVNRSPISRHAFTVHCISAAADYPAWNWLQRPADMPLRPLAGAIR